MSEGEGEDEDEGFVRVVLRVGGGMEVVGWVPGDEFARGEGGAGAIEVVVVGSVDGKG